jgi:hypothetical protein
MNQQVEIPFQIESIIKQMLDKNENVYVRGNFRSRLDVIRDVINQSIKKYDNELLVANTTGSNNRKRKSS